MTLQSTVMKITKNLPYDSQLFSEEGEVTVDMFRWEIAFDTTIGTAIEWIWAKSAVVAVKEFLSLHEDCQFFTVRLTSDNE